MPPRVTTIVGLAAVALAVWVVARGFHAPKAIGHDPSASGPRDGGMDDGADLLYAYGDAGASEDAALSLFMSDLSHPEVLAGRSDGGVGAILLDGTPVPALPFTAPRQVRFGIVLVAYAGAQPSAGGGRPATRSRADAKELAAKLSETAAQDFHAAVQQGDLGSSDDVGTVKMGILEPAPEYVLFTLSVNAVGGPVDTPRGYWIVKRLE